MKRIKYTYCTKVNHGTEGSPVWEDVLSNMSLPYSEANMAIAEAEAYGEISVEDDGIEEDATPTQLDMIEAQVFYTAMCTDTLIVTE